MVLVSLQVQLSVSNSTTSQNSLNSKTGLVCTSQFQAKSMSLYIFFSFSGLVLKVQTKLIFLEVILKWPKCEYFLTAFFWKWQLKQNCKQEKICLKISFFLLELEADN